jgi:hypothetical protein
MNPVYCCIMAWCTDKTITFFGAVGKTFKGFGFGQEGGAEESAAEFVLDKKINKRYCRADHG